MITALASQPPFSSYIASKAKSVGWQEGDRGGGRAEDIGGEEGGEVAAAAAGGRGGRGRVELPELAAELTHNLRPGRTSRASRHHLSRTYIRR